jgi:hypothetical protein
MEYLAQRYLFFGGKEALPSFCLTVTRELDIPRQQQVLAYYKLMIS